ncbi:DeoR/GlpR family DNA-binding transcription regulator [Dubosiella newyorkensis]|uniref:DeoR/GlpR family DNA-binding transcription regulator n=1 Tax=Dubosiella newyorkensis TaxID=1862672 RepID=UPI0023F059D1|nr:DeoR/GlpR family DNA-binding transcription regulator [Dubosiella newyorkensis]
MNMLKSERLQYICRLVNEKGIVTAAEIMNALDVSDMTVRRDLDELEKSEKLIRIHGGAQSINYNIGYELSHTEKSAVNTAEKKEIAKEAAKLIKDKDTIFLGPGTTIELLAQEIAERNVRIVTNSLPVFEIISQHDPEHVILAGGNYRNHTGCFVGPLCSEVIRRLKFSAAFISCNGLAENQITTSSIEEGQVQEIALNNAHKRYLLIDAHKFNREDFYVYYKLYNMDEIITDSSTKQDIISHYNQYIKITQKRKD